MLDASLINKADRNMTSKLFTIALLLALSLGLALPATAQLLPGSANSALGRGDRPRPLPMEQAFPYFISLVDDRTVEVTWQIAPEHYLYRHQFNFALQLPDQDSPRPLNFELPDGVAKTDPFFGDIEAYYGLVTARLAVDPALPQGTLLLIDYQGCAEWGFCYPPQSTSQPLKP